MSALLMGKVWQLDGLGRSERDVLLALADHAHEDGTSAKPGVPYLVWKLNLARSTVIGALRGLEGKGLIFPVVEGRGRGKVTEYELRLENGTPKAPIQEPVKRPISDTSDSENVRFSPSENVRFSLARDDEPREVDLEPSTPPSPLEQIRTTWSISSPPLIAHRGAYFESDKLARKIGSVLKVYPVEAITAAVRNYASVLGGNEYRWDYSWTLLDFLERGLDRFVDEARPLDNFRSSRKPAAPDLSPYEGIDDV